MKVVENQKMQDQEVVVRAETGTKTKAVTQKTKVATKYDKFGKAAVLKMACTSKKPNVDKLPPYMRELIEDSHKRTFWREKQQEINERRRAEIKLEQEMRQVLAPQEVRWVEDEHFRLLCGSGIDRGFLYLGFVAMLRSFDQLESSSVSKLKSYKRYLLKHIGLLNLVLTTNRKGALLRQELLKQRKMFIDNHQGVWPSAFADAIFGGQEQIAVSDI